MRPSSTWTAILTLLSAIFLFDVQGALIKLLGDAYPVSQIAVMRNLFGILPNLIALWWIVRAARKTHSVQAWHWVPDRWPLALMRGVVLTLAQISFYFSLSSLPLAIATTLAFSGPLFITLLSVPVLGERVGWVRFSAVCIGFFGVLLIIDPGGAVDQSRGANTGSFNWVILLPVLAAACYALVSLSTRLFDRSVPSPLINLYSTTVAGIGSLLLTLFSGSGLGVASLRDLLLILGMGSAGGVAVLLMVTAYRNTQPGNLAPFEYFGIPFSFVIGWLVFREAPFESLFPGVLFIVSGGLFIVFRERWLSRRERAL